MLDNSGQAAELIGLLAQCLRDDIIDTPAESYGQSMRYCSDPILMEVRSMLDQDGKAKNILERE